MSEETERVELPFDEAEIEREHARQANEATTAQSIIPVVIGALSVVALFVRPIGLYVGMLLAILGAVLGTIGARRGSRLAGMGRALSVGALCAGSIVLIVATATGSQAIHEVVSWITGLFRF